MVVAIQLSNQSAMRAFRDSVEAVAGRANYQIVGEAGPIDEEILLKLQPFWDQGVRFAPVIDSEGVVEPSQQPILLLGRRPPLRCPLSRLPLHAPQRRTLCARGRPTRPPLKSTSTFSGLTP